MLQDFINQTQNSNAVRHIRAAEGEAHVSQLKHLVTGRGVLQTFRDTFRRQGRAKDTKGVGIGAVDGNHNVADTMGGSI